MISPAVLPFSSFESLFSFVVAFGNAFFIPVFENPTLRLLKLLPLSRGSPTSPLTPSKLSFSDTFSSCRPHCAWSPTASLCLLDSNCQDHPLYCRLAVAFQILPCTCNLFFPLAFSGGRTESYEKWKRYITSRTLLSRFCFVSSFLLLALPGTSSVLIGLLKTHEFQPMWAYLPQTLYTRLHSCRFLFCYIGKILGWGTLQRDRFRKQTTFMRLSFHYRRYGTTIVILLLRDR